MDYPTFRCIVFVLGVLLALTLVGLRRVRVRDWQDVSGEARWRGWKK
jgi:hypothetical protein